VSQLFLLPLFSFWDSHLSLSRSLGVHQLPFPIYEKILKHVHKGTKVLGLQKKILNIQYKIWENIEGGY
jgi:hypothetical protein